MVGKLPTLRMKQLSWIGFGTTSFQMRIQNPITVPTADSGLFGDFEPKTTQYAVSLSQDRDRVLGVGD